MIRAVCFDFYNTLATHDPPREVAYAEICNELGIKAEPKNFAKALPAADVFWRDENTRSPIESKPQQEKLAFYAEYAGRIFSGAGIEINREAALQIMVKLQKYSWKFKAYDDSVPTLKQLKRRKLIVGLITNVVQDMEATYKELGLLPFLDFKVTSSEAGCDKPNPKIFQLALRKAKVKPEEAVYIGDQYDLDIIGSRNVGMKPLLIDRNDWFANITDCLRIRTLSEIAGYIQALNKRQTDHLPGVS